MTIDQLRAYFHATNPDMPDTAFAGWVGDLKLAGMLVETDGVFTKTAAWPADPAA